MPDRRRERHRARAAALLGPLTAPAELVGVEGRELCFELECQDEKERRRAPPDQGRGNRRVGWIFAIVTWW